MAHYSLESCVRYNPLREQIITLVEQLIVFGRGSCCHLLFQGVGKLHKIYDIILAFGSIRYYLFLRLANILRSLILSTKKNIAK